MGNKAIIDKREKRLKRAKKTRSIIKRTIKANGMCRLTVDRSNNHMSVQVIDPNNQILCSASTKEKTIRKQCVEANVKHCGNVAASRILGANIAERAKKQNVASVAFDRSGYRYHGRVKALLESAREAGLQEQ